LAFQISQEDQEDSGTFVEWLQLPRKVYKKHFYIFFFTG